MNADLEVDAELECFGCDQQVAIVGKEPIDPTEFPTPDAMKNQLDGP